MSYTTNFFFVTRMARTLARMTRMARWLAHSTTQIRHYSDLLLYFRTIIL